jgi:putative hemolysin
MIAFLIAVNAIYVAAEFAAVSARRSRLQQLAEEGHWLAARLVPFIRDPQALDRYVAACQIGITLSSLVLGAYGEARLAPTLAALFEGLGSLRAVTAHSVATGIVLVGLTTLQMVLGELVPKSIALQYPTRTALFTALPMRWSLRVFSAFISFLNGTGQAMLRIFGITPAEHRHVHTPEEIDLMVSESSESGVLPVVERERIREALRLSMRHAKQLMVPRENIEAISVEATDEDLLRAIAGPYTRLPVFQGSLDRVVGMIHTKDVVIHQLAHQHLPAVRDLLRPVLFLPENARADHVLALLREHRTQMALVTGDGWSVVGLVTLEDVLASVFGDVADEFKHSPSGKRNVKRER